MRVAIFGTGYVGLVTGACLAEVRHQVVCAGIDQAKPDALNRGFWPSATRPSLPWKAPTHWWWSPSGSSSAARTSARSSRP
ncbi:hypothetical protein EX530_11295 [Xanthomonas phaseoli]